MNSNVAIARWTKAFGPAAITAAHALATARQTPGDWRTILDELGLVEQVIKAAVGELLAHNDGAVIALSPLATDLLDLLPEGRWSRKQIGRLAMLWLGLSWRRDYVYDRVTGLAQEPGKAA